MGGAFVTAAFVRTPKSFDLVLPSASENPSAANPRFNSSRIAAARLGILRVKRQSSTALSSVSLSMICKRSARPLAGAISPPSAKINTTQKLGNHTLIVKDVFY
jgi:hypothetical protein